MNPLTHKLAGHGRKAEPRAVATVSRALVQNFSGASAVIALL